MPLSPDLEEVRSELSARASVFHAQGRPLTAEGMYDLAHAIERHRCEDHVAGAEPPRVDPNARCCGQPLDDRGRCQHRPHHRTPYFIDTDGGPPFAVPEYGTAD